MKKWKKLLFLIACLMFVQVSTQVMTTPVNVEAATTKEGLKKENGKYYYYENGKKVTNTWKTVRSYKFYFGKTGAAYTNTVVKIKNSYYGFNKYGRMLTNAWKTVKGNKYYFGKTGVAYKGTVLYGEKQIKIVKINGKSYGFDTYARMVKGDYVKNGKFYSFNTKTGVYDASRTSKLRSASKYEKNASTLRSLLGKPSKYEKLDGCYGGQEYYWYYKNVMVNVAVKNGKTVVLSVFAR